MTSITSVQYKKGVGLFLWAVFLKLTSVWKDQDFSTCQGTRFFVAYFPKKCTLIQTRNLRQVNYHQSPKYAFSC